LIEEIQFIDIFHQYIRHVIDAYGRCNI